MSDSSTPQDSAAMPPASAGSHGSASRWNGVPVAWAAVGRNGVPMWLAYHRQDAEGAVVGMAEVVPLYRSPTLTESERGAVRYMIAAAKFGQRDEALTDEHAATLRKMLDRLSPPAT